MTDSFIIGAYWGSRPEQLKQIVRKTLETLEKLSQLDNQYISWYKLGSSRKKALENKVELTFDFIEKICLSRIKPGEINDEGISKNGFTFGFWTGQKEGESSSISFVVGDEFDNKNLSNCCIINIPYEDNARERLLQLDKAKSIIEILIDIWGPDYAVLSSRLSNEKLNTINEIGWITYRKKIKRLPDFNNKILHQNYNNGHLFWLNVNNNMSYDYDLVSNLELIKNI